MKLYKREKRPILPFGNLRIQKKLEILKNPTISIVGVSVGRFPHIFKKNKEKIFMTEKLSA